MRTEQAIRPVALVCAGGLVGLLAKLGDERVSGAFSLVFSATAPYAAALVAIGWFARSPIRAAVESAAFFAPLCLSYYAAAAWIFGFPVARDSLFWTALAVTACPVGSALVHCARGAAWGWVALGVMAYFALGVGASRLYALSHSSRPAGQAEQVEAGVTEIALGVLIVVLARRPWPIAAACIVAVGGAAACVLLDIDPWSPLLWFLRVTSGR